MAGRGKTIFESKIEAQKLLRIMQPHGKLRLCWYSCPLCQFIHIDDRRAIALFRRMLSVKLS